MRIISGKLKGKLVPVIKNAKYRPITSKALEAVFNIVSNYFYDLKDVSILDLFAGTGMFGIEAISRNAKSVTFVDINTEYLNKIKNFILINNIKNQDVLYLKRDIKRLKISDKIHNIVFIDPPYYLNILTTTLKKVYENSWIDDNSIVFIKYGTKTEIEIPEYYRAILNKKFGNTNISMLILKCQTNIKK